MKVIRSTSPVLLFLSFVLLFALAPVSSASAAGLADGQYSAQYVVWKADSDSTSTANTYFEKPAKLVVKGGKIKAQVTLTNSSWITSFKTLDQGVYKDAKVISTNAAANKRTVEFNVNSLTEVVPAKVSVTVPAIGYTGNYDIRLKFDTASVQ
ncbi:NEAT domain-containing protein [Bacillus safensis]|uniref:NEAT domain-containing protein n=1 Tax=Bacillus safensis TaxID=561879 RepID=UPI0020C998A1|nr:NEAT domain-containing protein [Bacillus safensis]MCP8952134.1 NEAT domain-containing protein [Bacillus safensis]MEC3736477.1 NEAT domain-containing protein [Bacillus safensis]